MKIISDISNDILDVFKKQKYRNDCEYKQIKYLKFLNVDCGVLIYNLLTNEMILLDNNEYNCFINNTLKEDNFILYSFLVKHWYFIPNEFNEKMMVYLYRNMKQSNVLLSNFINTFIILTTTDCNARCYYCFELGTKRINMSNQTAMDVAKYIEEKANPELPVRISWFGGEPLYNSDVIDIITGYLKEKNIKYVSTMVTNGYLFNDSNVKKSKELWNLKNVQITLDGTEEVYNKTKAFIYKNDNNAFKTVLNNIERLISNSINVNIRCNTSKNNYNDLYKLVDVIDERFKNNRKYLSIYFAVLFEEAKQLFYSDFPHEERNFIHNEMYKLEDYAKEKGLFKVHDKLIKSLGGIKTTHCMVTDSSTVLVSPEGKLGSCEHYVDSDFFGSIYDEYYNLNRDYSNIHKWREKSKDIPECDNCHFYPKCFRINGCEPDDPYPVICNKFYRKIDGIMLNTYKKYLYSESKIKKEKDLNEAI